MTTVILKFSNSKTLNKFKKNTQVVLPGFEEKKLGI